jgi:hypothetical protein
VTRFCIAFLAGSLLTAAGVMLADSRTGVMFIAGGIALLILQAALLASTGRARRFAGFALAVCDSLDTPGRRTRYSASNRQVEAHALSAHAGPDRASRQDQIAAALRTFGMNRKKAGVVASEAVAGGGTFPEMIRRATGAPEGESDPLTEDLFGPVERRVN